MERERNIKLVLVDRYNCLERDGIRLLVLVLKTSLRVMQNPSGPLGGTSPPCEQKIDNTNFTLDQFRHSWALHELLFKILHGVNHPSRKGPLALISHLIEERNYNTRIRMLCVV